MKTITLSALFLLGTLVATPAEAHRRHRHHHHNHHTGITINLDGFAIRFGGRNRHYGSHYPEGHHRHNHCSAGTGYQGCHYN